ncbi:RabGAP/TBC [Ramaria rubella]|nr:RabGAP/TBC [Ramaria rubella]
MYTDKRETWATNTKVLALKEVDPTARARPQSVDLASQAWRGSPDITLKQTSTAQARPRSAHNNWNRVSKPPSSFQNGYVVVPSPDLDLRHSTAASSFRISEDSISLPYNRTSLPSQDDPPAPPTPPKPPSRHLSRKPSTDNELPSPPTLQPPPHADPSGSSPNLSIESQRGEGEDADSFHVRSTYAQLDAEGVRGDGYADGVELTRAKQGGTTYLTSQPDDRGRGSVATLNPQELAVLASVDRYGFIVAPSAPSDRLLLLPSLALVKPLSIIHSSSSSSPLSPTPPALSHLPPTELTPAGREKELSRTAKWGRMLESGMRNGRGDVLAWRVVLRKERKLRERVYKGIPDPWRAAAWGLLVERIANTTRSSQDSLARQYRETLDKPSSFDIQIDLDVPRTISGHVLFRTRYGLGQRSLFHVLHAFSLLCPDCGYVQGMGPIAATLLCYYEPEKVYTMLVHLHSAYAMHTIFSPGFPGLLESIYVQERVMERFLPDVYASFKKHMISSTSYTTKWYITLFANSVPFQTQLRLWDAFFLEGRDMIVVVAVAILWVFKDQLTSATANFETILSLLSSFFVPESEDALMKWIERALGDQKLRADMKTWRQEWHQLVAEGRDRDVLL